MSQATNGHQLSRGQRKMSRNNGNNPSRTKPSPRPPANSLQLCWVWPRSPELPTPAPTAHAHQPHHHQLTSATCRPAALPAAATAAAAVQPCCKSFFSSSSASPPQVQQLSKHPSALSPCTCACPCERASSLAPAQRPPWVRLAALNPLRAPCARCSSCCCCAPCCCLRCCGQHPRQRPRRGRLLPGLQCPRRCEQHRQSRLLQRGPVAVQKCSTEVQKLQYRSAGVAVQTEVQQGDGQTVGNVRHCQPNTPTNKPVLLESVWQVCIHI